MRRIRIIQEEQLDNMLSRRKASRIETYTVDTEYVKKNPAYLALSVLEQKAYLLHLTGKINNEIGAELDLKPYQVTRLLQGIRAKLLYLYGFRTLLAEHPEFKRKFYNEQLTNDSHSS